VTEDGNFRVSVLVLNFRKVNLNT